MIWSVKRRFQMTIRIVSRELLNTPGYRNTPDQVPVTTVVEEEVNQLLKDHPGATVTWLQSGGAGKYGSFTQLTAIVSW